MLITFESSKSTYTFISIAAIPIYLINQHVRAHFAP